MEITKTISISPSEITKKELEKIEKLNDNPLEKSKIEILLDKLDLSAEIKALLSYLLDFSISIGKKIFYIGIKILKTLFYFIKTFKSFSINFLLGAILAYLIAQIPLIGSWLVNIVLGFTVGKSIYEEMKGNVKEKFEQFWNELKEIWGF